MPRHLLLILCLALAVVAQTPPVPLPPVTTPPRLAPSTPAPAGARRLELPAGWSILSLPVARAEGLAGLDHQLYRQTSEGFVLVDPSRGPLDSRLAYWAYSERPQKLLCWGQPAGETPPVRLFAGWNLIGCPSERPVPLSGLSLEGPDGHRTALEQAAAAPAPGHEPWIAARAYRVRPDAPFAVEQLELASPTAALQPGEALWVYAYQPLELAFNPSRGPRVDSTRAEGKQVILTGSGLDETDHLTVEGVPLPASSILQATPERLVVRLPDGLSQGVLVPYDGTAPGTRVRLDGSGQSVLEQGLLSGRVQDSEGEPLAGAQIAFGSQATTSGPDGRFYLAKLPAGSYDVRVSAAGHKPGSGQVAISPGKLSSLLVTLSPLQPRAYRNARVFLTAYPFQLGERRFWVKSIRAWQVGNYNRRDYDSWWIDASSRQLDWGDAPLGARIRVEVVWTDGRTEKFTAWDRRIWKDWQSERFYSPWD